MVEKNLDTHVRTEEAIMVIHFTYQRLRNTEMVGLKPAQ